MKKVDTTFLPIFLLFCIPILIFAGLDIFYWIRWDVFGITEGINPFYLQFGSMWKSDLWILHEMGIIGSIFLILTILGSGWIVVQTVKMLIELIKNGTKR